MQDVVHHGHGQIAIGRRLHGNELVGETGGAVEDEAEVDDARTGLASTYEVLGAAHLVLDGIATPNVDEIRADHDAWVDHGAGKLAARVIELGIEGTVIQTDRAERNGDAKGVRETERHQVLEAVLGGDACAEVPENDLIRAMLVTNLAELLANLVESLIPANFLELPAPALTHALERFSETFGIVGLATREAALLANVPIGLFRLRVDDALHALDLAIFHDGLERTVVMVTPTGTSSVDERFFRHAKLLSLFLCWLRHATHPR